MNITGLEIAQSSIEFFCGIASAMLAVIVLINGRKRVVLRSIARMLLIASVIFFAEACAYYYRGNTDTLSLFATRISNFTVFSLNMVLALLSMQFAYLFLKEKGANTGGVYRIIVQVCCAIAGIILLTNSVTGWMYYFDAQNYYRRNFAWYLFTGLSVICMTSTCILCIRYRKYLTRLSLYSILFHELFPLIAVVIQMFYYGIAITNIGIGVSIIFVLVTYLIDLQTSRDEHKMSDEKARHSFELIVLYVIMIISIGSSVISCTLSLSRISDDVSVGESRIIAQMVNNRLETVMLRPITVAETMSKGNYLKEYMKKGNAASPEAVEQPIADYLQSIWTGFDYPMVYAVSSQTNAYYTYNGICKYVDPQNPVEDAWYWNFISNPDIFRLEVDTDKTNQWGLSVFVNAQILDDDGSLLGVCGIGVEMDELRKVLLEFEREHNVKVTLMDQDGLILVDSDLNRIEQDYLPTDYLKNVGSDQFYCEQLQNSRRLTKYIENLDWYLVVEDVVPDKINLSELVIPNIAIFLTGMFVLAVVFSVIIIQERKTVQELLEKRRMSMVDELTGLQNRRAFDMARAEIEKNGTVSNVTIIALDLNGLKQVNDTLGHQAGDEFILGISNCMMNAFNQLGHVYRTGGDEFFVLLDCSQDQLTDALKTFDYRVSTWKGNLVQSLSVSKGAASGVDHPDLSFQELMNLADQRMYEDKEEYYRRNNLKQRRRQF